MKVKGKSDDKIKINKPNRNIKPICHTNDEIKVLWSLDNDLAIDKNIFGGYIKSTVVPRSEENWMEILDTLKKYIDENGKKPCYSDKNLEVKKLGKWISHQVTNYNKNQHSMTNKKIKQIWEKFTLEYKNYFITKETLWLNKLKDIKKYIDEKNNLPSYDNWINRQKRNYEKKMRIMKNENIRKKWIEFTCEYDKYLKSCEEIWLNKLDNVKKYIDKNKKMPSSCDKNKNIKILGNWISNQKINFRKKINLMKNNEIKKEWMKFVNEYDKYFKSNEDLWMDKLNDTKEYINKHKKKPSSTSKNENVKFMGGWLHTQAYNYENNKCIMQNNKIRKEWEFFCDEYSEYIDEKKAWDIMLLKISKYIDEYCKKPTRLDKNDDIKKMASWLAHQLHDYKYNTIADIKKNDFCGFVEKYKSYLMSSLEEWFDLLEQTKNYIDTNNKKPSRNDNCPKIKKLGSWLNTQNQNYLKNKNCMKDINIKNAWESFIKNSKYAVYFSNNCDIWLITLNEVEKYISQYNDKPSNYDKHANVKKLGQWLRHQIENYKNNSNIMKDDTIKKKWEQFVTKHKKYFPDNPAIKDDMYYSSESESEEEIPKKLTKKSTTIKPKEEKIQIETTEQINKRKISEYQELTKKMSIQKSETTKKMFKENSDLWHKYHDNRDFSFKGYNKQEDIPVNKIIAYLETKSNKKLKILDLGCGRNTVKEHFKDNKKLDITGYDYVSYNGSIVCDISDLPEEDETIDICVYSQSLMGSNWKEYLDEGFRVLRYNGEMIISESIDRYDLIKKYIDKLGYHIKLSNNEKTNRWFYLHVINDKS